MNFDLCDFHRPLKITAFACTLAILSASFFSCDSPPPQITVCECTGTNLEVIKNERGIVINTGRGKKIISEHLGYVSLCGGTPEEFSADYTLVKFNGKRIPECTSEDKTYLVWITEIELDSISQIFSIEKIGDITIEIIYSTNYWGETGWGYELIDTKSDFKIHQDQIPGISGNKQFDSVEEARLFAILMAYKLNSVKDFPSITNNDLCFLRKYICS